MAMLCTLLQLDYDTNSTGFITTEASCSKIVLVALIIHNNYKGNKSDFAVLVAHIISVTTASFTPLNFFIILY